MDEFLEKEIQEFQELTADTGLSKNLVYEELIKQIEPFVAELSDLRLRIDEMEAELKSLKTEEAEHEDSIRKIWEPFIKGTNKAELNLPDGSKLEAVKGVSFTNVDTELSTTWLLTNGYKDAMKYQIHHATLNKIAKEEFAKGTLIPGLRSYSYIKIKIK